MEGWRSEDEPSGSNQPSAWSRFGRLAIGQLLIVVAIGGTVWFRLNQDTTNYAQTGGARPATVNNNAAPPTAANRADVEVPAEVSSVGRRFLQSLAASQYDVAARDVARDAAVQIDGSRLPSTARPFVVTQARNFRTQFWQVATASEPARLVIGFDYTRPDGGEGRARVTLRMSERNGTWTVSDLDLSTWLSDLGLPRAG